jgi:hypothetical protein
MMKASAIKIQYPEDIKLMEIVLTTNKSYQVIDEISKLKEVVAKGKELTVDIKPFRKKRSLDANGMLWAILNQMAEMLKTSKDEVYLEMLNRYGVFTHVIVKSDVVEKVKREWKTVRELGGVTVNGKTGIQLQCYFGSSTYDSKEFSVLLEGVISEAKELGIDTIRDDEKQRLLNDWGQR